LIEIAQVEGPQLWSGLPAGDHTLFGGHFVPHAQVGSKPVRAMELPK